MRWSNSVVLNYYFILSDFSILPFSVICILPSTFIFRRFFSHCGTVIGLIQRLYDATEGEVLIDGEDVKSVNVKSIRNDIGIVSQEPVLFAASIIENIRYGMDNVSNDDIFAAAKRANAHSFIKKLQNGMKIL